MHDLVSRSSVFLVSLGFGRCTFADIRLHGRATLPDANKVSEGSYRNLGHFQEKVLAQKYIQEQKIPAVFVCPTVSLPSSAPYNG